MKKKNIHRISLYKRPASYAGAQDGTRKVAMCVLGMNKEQGWVRVGWGSKE